jgi:hypothetical protein
MTFFQEHMRRTAVRGTSSGSKAQIAKTDGTKAGGEKLDRRQDAPSPLAQSQSLAT